MENKIKRKDSDFINRVLWGIYALLLLVLLPHTAWMFSQAEPTAKGFLGIAWGLGIAWAAATVFECVIAVMTHKLSNHISNTPKYSDNWKRFKTRYINAYGAGLLLAWMVSTYANLAHAVEFGQPIKIFSNWGWPIWTYSVAFGAILPTASLLFAWVLSSVIEQDANEGQPNPEVEKLKVIIKELNQQMKVSEDNRIIAEQRMKEAETRFQAAGDLFSALFADKKRDRIIFTKQKWPALPGSAIAILTETSPALVSETLKEIEK